MSTEGDKVKTVKELRDELAKFPDDAKCYAYEGESTGVVIRGPNGGIVHCCELDIVEQITEVITEVG